MISLLFIALIMHNIVIGYGSTARRLQQTSRPSTAIKNVLGKCVDVHAPDIDVNGAYVQVWDCNGRVQQTFYFEPSRVEGRFLIKSAFTNDDNCLDVNDLQHTNNENGAKVTMWDCNGQDQQQWYIEGNAIKSSNGKCLDVHVPDISNNGGKIQIWDCNGRPQQQFSVTDTEAIKPDNPTKVPTKIPTTKPTAQPITKIPTTKIPTTKAPTKIPTPFPTFAVCNTNIGLDIAFLIDESGSIEPHEFDTLNSFIKRVIDFDINDASFVSLFQYADTDDFQNILPFTSVAGDGRKNIINAVNNNQQAKGDTKTGHAIRKTLEYFDTNANNNGRPDLLFVLTDGKPTDYVCGDVNNPIDRKNVEIVLIGIGDGVTLDLFTNYKFNCLYDNVNNDVYMIPQFTQQAFNDKEAALREKTCIESVSAHSMPQFVYNYDIPSKVQPLLSPISVKNIVQIVFIALITNLIVYLLIYKCCIQRQLFGKKNTKKHKYEFVGNEEDQEEKIKIINDQ